MHGTGGLEVVVFDRFQRYVEILEPGFHMIVMIVAIAKNGCDDPDDHMETPIFFLVSDDQDPPQSWR